MVPKPAAAQRPLWQLDLLQQSEWTFSQVLSALSGEDPDQAPMTIDEWNGPRHRVARLVEAAIQNEEFVVEYFRTRTYDHPYGDFRVSSDQVIRWAAARRKIFPNFPFSLKNLPRNRKREPPEPRAKVEALSEDSVTPSRQSTWLKDEMHKRDKMSAYRLHKVGGPAAKTIRAIRDGKTVSTDRRVLQKLALGLSHGDGPPVSPEDIPRD